MRTLSCRQRCDHPPSEHWSHDRGTTAGPDEMQALEHRDTRALTTTARLLGASRWYRSTSGIRRLTTFGLLLVIAFTGAANGATTATRIGPDGGPINWMTTAGNRVYAFGFAEDVNPTPGIGGNAWVSTDAGVNWHAATRAELAVLPNDADFGVVVHPNDKRVLYRLRGRPAHMLFQVSVDAGATWRTRSQLREKGLSWLPSVTIAPTRPLATVLLTGWSNSGTRSLYLRSTDGGRTWTRPTVRPRWINSVTAAPGHAKTLYMTSPGASGSAVWLYRSRDAGATWDLGNRRKLPVESLDDEQLILNPWRPDVMLLNSDFGQGVFRSTDRGAHWVKVISDPVNDVLVDHAHPGVVFATNDAGILRSRNLGGTWTPSNAGIRNASVEHISIGGGRIYLKGQLGTGPLTSSTDGGATWSPVPTGDTFALNGVPSLNIATDSSDSSRIIVAGSEGLTWTDDGGAHWNPTGIEVAALTNDAATGEIYALTPYGRVMTAQHVGDQLVARGVAPMTPGIAFVARAGVLYLTGGQPPFGLSPPHYLMRSFDGGRTWTRSANIAGGVLDVAMAPSDPMTAYVREQNGITGTTRLLVTHNGGTSWTRLALKGVPPTGLTTVTVDAADPLRLYAGVARPGVWTSTDGGMTWAQLSTQPHAVAQIVQNPGNAAQLFVGTWEFGFWRVEKDVL